MGEFNNFIKNLEELLIYGHSDQPLNFNLTSNPSQVSDSVKQNESALPAKDVSVSVIKLGQDFPQMHEKYKNLLKRLFY